MHYLKILLVLLVFTHNRSFAKPPHTCDPSYAMASKNKQAQTFSHTKPEQSAVISDNHITVRQIYRLSHSLHPELVEGRRVTNGIKPKAALAKPTTVFIHGTLFSLFSKLVATFDCPRGFYLSSTLSHKRTISRIPDLLHTANRSMFPLDSFYLFGWSGYLDSDIRKQAARELYYALKKITGPITLICHSHGGNVALNLAQVAQEHNDRDFKIEKLILLATPVQEINATYVNSSLFKKVYVLYSSADFVQILDPQNMYRNIQNPRSNNIFSQRYFPNAPHIIQAKIIINRKSPAHIDFMLSKILRHLPSIITLLDQQFEIDANKKNKHYSIIIKKQKRSSDKTAHYYLEPLKI